MDADTPSLDKPPIVIRSARWKAALSVVGALVFVAIGSWIAGAAGESLDEKALGFACVGFFGFCGVVAAGRLVRPPALELSPEGLRLARAFRPPVLYAWREIGPFRTWAYGRTRIVVFDVAGPRKTSARFNLNRSLSGADASLPTGWGMRPEALAELLNAAKARWS